MKTRNRLKKRRWVFAAALCLFICMAEQPGAGEPVRVLDIDGNTYGTVQIGNQIWMTENLRVTRYNDGTEIPFIADPAEWRRSKTGAYAWYDNDPSNAAGYGALYNWYAVETGKLCPPGWRVPTDEDWDELITFLRTNGSETDFISFAALPGGYRWWRTIAQTGCFYEKGDTGYWWTSTEAARSYAWNRAFRVRTGLFLRSFFPKGEGFSVRAVKIRKQDKPGGSL